jgi:hypothetical protein
MENQKKYDFGTAFLMTGSKIFPDIENFQKLFFRVETLKETLTAIRDVTVIQWLRIDVHQIKYSSFARLQEWRGSHMLYLTSFINSRLRKISSFIFLNQRLLKEASELSNENSLLTPVLLIIKQIRQEGVEIEGSMELLSAMIEFVKQFATELYGDLSLIFSEVMASWAELQKHTMQVKGVLSHLISAEIEHLSFQSASLQSFVVSAKSSLEQTKASHIGMEESVELVTTDAYDSMMVSKIAIDFAVHEIE